MQRPSLNILIGKDNLVGCEVGVEFGSNSFEILSTLDIKKLYLVDPYPVVPSGPDWVYQDSDEAGSAKFVAHNRLSIFSNKIVWVEKFSGMVTDEDIPDDSLDFVYIDGDHSYTGCKTDLEVYYKKVKAGGLFAGHDYGATNTGVKRAVLEFCAKMKLPEPKHQTDTWKGKIGGRDDWWLIKNRPL